MSIYKLDWKNKRFLDTFRALLERNILRRQAERLSKEGKTNPRIIRHEADEC